jgi:hypothetical protein
MRAWLCTLAATISFALAAGGDSLAQNKVRTETIRPPAAPAAPPPSPAPKTAVPIEIITDLARLPPRVARMRERILEAARSGSLDKVVTVMQSNETMPIFSHGGGRDPAAYWKANYPDSEGLEMLAILVTILEASFVHVDKGTPQEMYVWPSFARLPLSGLSANEKVELFRIVTGSDYRKMLVYGGYNFYHVGIGPDGTWHFFVAGN